MPSTSCARRTPPTAASRSSGLRRSMRARRRAASPTITTYTGAEKLYETHPGDECETIKAEVKKALDAVV